MRVFVASGMMGALMLAGAAFAQQAGHDHSAAPASGHDMPMPAGPKGEKTASSEAFAAANKTMHGAMDLAYTGDADVDFVRGMIPHHQGAIEMAKIELRYGKDAETKRLAEGIIKAQEAEIASMKAWLAKRGK
jgi:uncharacterized protein (DUF305 family)